ncbi:hypothetical protein [Microbacterium sp. 77mftsu3.1]|uniref:hypothetical protein n=1 Tax=Microbacterium sp. 77mftsu3.1 TaxID=1761802 RepID=UPI000362E6DC|nr:hypothetical protein [Microbacterium sp. 77mftsu3.1]SDH54764.1 hypothetical protein SAMN04488590_3540 [Microbacterium sp. 77mftsu3.1]
MSAAPHLFLDIDEVVRASSLKYGHEQIRQVEEHIPTELVHPAMRPKSAHVGSGGEMPEWLARRRHKVKPRQTFRTRCRVSPKLFADIMALGVDVTMLTTWLEHDSVDAFFAECYPTFVYEKLNFPGRDFSDPLGAIPADWKYLELCRSLDADPRPFIWADDDEVPIWRDKVEARYPDLPKLLIAPLDDIGLTPFHMTLMREFAAEHGGAPLV